MITWYILTKNEARQDPVFILNVGDKVLIKNMNNKFGYKRKSKYLVGVCTIVENKDGKYKLNLEMIASRSMLVTLKK